MITDDFAAFETQAHANGFDEVLRREWQPDIVVAEHTHPFDAHALVVHGEMWLTCAGVTRHIEKGSTFDVPKGTLHAERYGSTGVSFWVARRN